MLGIDEQHTLVANDSFFQTGHFGADGERGDAGHLVGFDIVRPEHVVDMIGGVFTDEEDIVSEELDVVRVGDALRITGPLIGVGFTLFQRMTDDQGFH